MGRGGGSSGRAGVSTPSGRVAQSPTEQAWTVTQHQGPARSGRARGGHQVPVGTTGAVTPRLSPLPALPERTVPWASAGGHGRRRSHGRKQRAHRSLQNRKERGFAQRPQPSSSSSSRSTEKIRCSTASQVSRLIAPTTPRRRHERQCRSACAASPQPALGSLCRSADSAAVTSAHVPPLQAHFRIGKDFRRAKSHTGAGCRS